jgi:hypothetical protein
VASVSIPATDGGFLFPSAGRRVEWVAACGLDVETDVIGGGRRATSQHPREGRTTMVSTAKAGGGAGGKGEKFPIHILDLSAIKVDHALQSRVATSMEYQREFSEAMLRGDEFPPITVFEDAKGKYWLADGFHRYGARKIVAKSDRKFQGIRAEVRKGSRDDAMVFSAGANQKFSIPRTKEDIKKAIFMLLGIEDWQNKPIATLSSHVGCSNSTLRKYMVDYFNSRGLDIPKEIARIDGKTMRRRTSKDKPTLLEKSVNQGKSKEFWFKEKGRQIYLGTDRVAADAKLSDFLDNKKAARLSLTPAHMANFLAWRGFSFLPANLPSPQYPGLSSRYGHGVVFTCEALDRNDYPGSIKTRPFNEAVGSILLSRQKLDPKARAVIVCYPEDILPTMLDLGRQLGIEFLTPEEFVASLAPPADPAPPTEPADR